MNLLGVYINKYKSEFQYPDAYILKDLEHLK